MDRFECRHFRGDKPCAFSQGRACGPVVSGSQCANYQPLGHKTLIIKLGALGDVLRTTTLLPPLVEKYPNGAVTWITAPNALPLLAEAGLWKVMPWNVDTVMWAQRLAWDTVISLDKEEGPTTLAENVQAKEKFGFGRNKHGLLRSLAPATDYLFKLGMDDEEKFHVNTRTYPNLVADACELPWKPNAYVLHLSETENTWRTEFTAAWGEGPFIGLNPGSGEGFAGKKWVTDHYVELARRLKEAGFTPVFLGGASEKKRYAELHDRAWEWALFPGCEFTLRQFSALVGHMKALLSGDTLAMHIAIALGVYSVALFGSTTEREIEFYGRGTALVGKVPCGPCYKRVCPTQEECMQAISVETVFQALVQGAGKEQG
jgi:heptosyltransferase-2